MEVPSIFLNRLLAEVAKKKASDLHLSVGSLPMIRVDGELRTVDEASIVTADLLKKIIDSLLSQDEFDRLKKNREIIIAKNIAGNFRFKINVLYQKDLPSVNFHYIAGLIKPLADYKLPPIFKSFLQNNTGLIILTGSYGSGKTSTAASFVEEINRSCRKYVVTIEDPIEYLFVGKKSIIEQRQVGLDVKNSAEGLSYCLSEDCDVVYVSSADRELKETMQQAVDLASGNALVIMEINFSSATRVIEKVLDSLSDSSSVESARHALSDVLLAVLAQKLIPKRGGGLAFAAEILIANSAVKSMIREGKIYQIETIMQTSRQEGMMLMSKAIDELVETDAILPEEAAKIKNEF